MRTAFPAFLIVVQVLLSAGAAGAQSIEAARAAHAEGRFLEAAELGEALKSSEGYALAAEALAIHGYYIAGSDEKEALFQRAMQLAQAGGPLRSGQSGGVISNRPIPWAATDRQSER